MDEPLRAHPMQRPYPLLALLDGSALLREDIAGDCPGVPLALSLRLVAAGGLAHPLAHAAVCLWHCDSAGLMHDDSAEAPDRIGRLTRLRGVQVSDALGRLRFRTIYPGAHTDGRALLHLQVYLSDAVQVTGIAHARIVLPQHETLRVQSRRGFRLAPIGLGYRGPADATPAGPLLEDIALDGNPSAGYHGRLTIAIRSPSTDPLEPACRNTTIPTA